MKKQLLQISNDFADQKIYVNLVRRLSGRGFSQIVYVPIKWKSKINGNRDDTILNVQYHYSYILKRNILFKLLFHRKINIILKDLESKINLNEIGLVHAHFLFSDGGVAYLLKKKYKIPYVVSVRASDIYTFFPKMLHLRKLGNKIMNDAERVIFINYSYLEIFKEKYHNKAYHGILEKTQIIPNAIQNKWFENAPSFKLIKSITRILYVGRLVKRKKLDIVIKAIKVLNKHSNNQYALEVVGKGEYYGQLKKLANDQVFFHGQITNFEKLLEIYRRCHIFAMPSIKETFGLVYIEAMSQGLPVIYCKNEGIDGYFNNNRVGVAVRPNKVMDVVNGIKFIEDHYDQISAEAINASKRFNWNEITENFVEIYKKSLHSN